MSAAEYKKHADGINKTWNCGRVDCEIDVLSLSAQLTDIISKLDRLAGVPNDISEVKAEVVSINNKISVLEPRILNVEKRLDELEAKLVSGIEAKSSSIIDVEKRLEAIESNLRPVEGHSPDEIIAELNDRQFRAANVIAFKVPESRSANNARKKEHDLGKIQTILAASGLDKANLKTFFRLGKVSGRGPRPLKLVFKSRESALELLKNFNTETVSDADPALSDMSVSSDKTPGEQRRLKELREELVKRKESGEANLTIKYFNGIPRITESKN